MAANRKQSRKRRSKQKSYFSTAAPSSSVAQTDKPINTPVTQTGTSKEGVNMTQQNPNPNQSQGITPSVITIALQDPQVQATMGQMVTHSVRAALNAPETGAMVQSSVKSLLSAPETAAFFTHCSAEGTLQAAATPAMGTHLQANIADARKAATPWYRGDMVKIGAGVVAVGAVAYGAVKLAQTLSAQQQQLNAHNTVLGACGFAGQNEAGKLVATNLAIES